MNLKFKTVTNIFDIKLLLGLFAIIFPLPNATAQGGDQNSSRALVEVIVTAERRVAREQDVPVSLTVFDSEYTNKYIMDPIDVAELTPNYQIFSNEGLTLSKAALRGLGSSDQANPLAPTSILTYYDNIPAGTPFVATLPQWDIERIEVARGPQGTLFGLNAVGGMVRWESSKPTEEFEAFAQARFGKDQLRRVEGAVSGPITDNIQARASFLTHDRGHNKTNTFLNVGVGEQEWWGVRGIVDWQIQDNTSARLKVQHFEGEAEAIQFNTARSDQMTPDQAAWLSAIGVDPNRDKESNFELISSDLRDPFEDVELDMVDLEINHDFGPVTLTGIGTYLDASNQLLNEAFVHPAPSDTQLQTMSFEQWTGEVRLSSEPGSLPGIFENLDFQAGAFFQTREDSFRVDLDLTAFLRDSDGDGLTRHNADSPEDLFDGFAPSIQADTVFLGADNIQQTDSYAFFLDTNYHWTDKIKTTHSVRYTDVEKDMDFLFAHIFDFPVSAGVTPGSSAQFEDFMRFGQLTHDQQRQQAVSIVSDPNPVDSNGNVEFTRLSTQADELTWRFGLDYKMTNDVMFFGSFSKGFRGPIFAVNASPSGAASADPETSQVIELGMKSRWFDGRLQANITGFYNEHEDLQSTLADLSRGLNNVITNIDQVDIFGGEFQIQAIPIENMILVLNVGILDTEVKEIRPGNEGLLGNELPNAEKFNFSGLAGYDIYTNYGTFTPQATWRYRGEYWSKKENDDLGGRIGDFWVLNLALEYESLNEKVYGLLAWDNVFDEVQSIENGLPTAGPAHTASNVNAERRWSLQVGYRF